MSACLEYTTNLHACTIFTLFSRHANREEKKEIRERLEGIKRGKSQGADSPLPSAGSCSRLDDSTPTPTGTPNGHLPSPITTSPQTLSDVLAVQIAALKEKLGIP